MNKLLKWRLGVLAIFTTLLGGTFIFKPDVDKTGGLVADIKLADIEKPKITIPKKSEKKKTSQPKRAIKKAPKPKTKPKVKPVWKPPANIIFSETFSSFPVGHLMSNWGDDLVVKSTQSGGRGRKFLTSQTPGEYHSMTIPINFSKHWNMSILSRQQCGALLGIVFYDDSGNSLPIKCSWRNCFGPMYLSFPGAATKITTPFRIEKGMYPIDISYIKGVLKFVMSNEHIYSGRLTYNHAFTRVQFTWQDYKQSSQWWKRAPDFYKIEVRKVEGRPAGAKTTTSTPKQPPVPTYDEPPSYDAPPSPIGGFSAIQRALKYPEVARQAGIQGRVIVQVLVSEKGKVIDTRIWQSLGRHVCDEAAIEALKKVRWEPASRGGKPVPGWVSMPVIFKLD